MTHPIIKTENYLLVVDKLNCPAKEGQTFLTKEGLIHTNIGWNYGDSVIIYHLPLNNAPTLEGVPLLPPLEDESNFFAEQETIKNEWNSEKSFKAGYNKAKEKYRWTDEDLRKALSESFKASQEGYNITCDEIIQSLQQPKYPVSFESTIGVCSKWLAEQCDNNCCGKPEKIITITNSQELTQLVGKYIY